MNVLWTIVLGFFILGIIYSVISVVLFVIFLKSPRRPVTDIPDWGTVEEHMVPAKNGKQLECWVVRNGTSDDLPAIILTHGWGRNRGRMVKRAQILGNHGFTTILFSARDHGQSGKERWGMHIYKFFQDISSVVEWWGKPVVLLGHSIGAGASLLASAQNEKVIGVISEASPAVIPHSLRYIYRSALGRFTSILFPGFSVGFWILFRKLSPAQYSPVRAIRGTSKPILFIHGQQDLTLPSSEARQLLAVTEAGTTWEADRMDHHNIAEHPQYEEKLIGYLSQLFSRME